MLYKGVVQKLVLLFCLVTLLFPSSFVSAAAALTTVSIIEFVTSTPEQPGGGGWSDRIFPLIVDVRIKRLSNRSVEISWDASEETESYFALGFTNNYELGEKHLPGYSLTHKVVLSELELNTKYLFRIVVIDRGGNSASSFNFFILLENLPAPVPEPEPLPQPRPQPSPQPVPEPPLPSPQPSPQPSYSNDEREPFASSQPSRLPRKPIISIPPAEPPVVIPTAPAKEDKIISDVHENIPVEEKVVKKERSAPHIASSLPTPVSKVKTEIMGIASFFKNNLYLLIPNKIFAVPDFAYGPFILSVLLFILSLFA